MDGLILSPFMYERMLDGVLMTLQILAYSFALGIVLSLLVGVARLSEHIWLRGPALVFVEFARGISSIILLFIMAYAIPILLGVDQRNLVVLGSIALGINMGGYGAEIIRGAIQSVPRGQTEASIALNLSPSQRLRHVVLPQAMRVILPPMGNLTIEILKGTALVSLIGLADILFEVNLFRSRQMAPTPVLYLNVLIIYFIIAQVINGLFRFGESRLDRRFRARTGDLPSTDALHSSVAAK